jgi:hypothetical protein
MTGSNNIIIQPRDLKLLRTTALLRAIDREQARAIGGFRSTTRVNATMLRLVKAGLLNRFFLGVGPGTQKSIYTISRKGAALSGAAYRRFRRKNNGLYSGDIFLEHQLLLNEIYISLCKPGSQAGKTGKPLKSRCLIPPSSLTPILNWSKANSLSLCSLRSIGAQNQRKSGKRK